MATFRVLAERDPDADAALASAVGCPPPPRSLTPPRRPLSDQRGRAARGCGAAEIVRFRQRGRWRRGCWFAACSVPAISSLSLAATNSGGPCALSAQARFLPRRPRIACRHESGTARVRSPSVLSWSGAGIDSGVRGFAGGIATRTRTDRGLASFAAGESALERGALRSQAVPLYRCDKIGRPVPTNRAAVRDLFCSSGKRKHDVALAPDQGSTGRHGAEVKLSRRQSERALRSPSTCANSQSGSAPTRSSNALRPTVAI
jgi:hypothetical protein